MDLLQVGFTKTFRGVSMKNNTIDNATPEVVIDKHSIF